MGMAYFTSAYLTKGGIDLGEKGGGRRHTQEISVRGRGSWIHGPGEVQSCEAIQPCRAPRDRSKLLART